MRNKISITVFAFVAVGISMYLFFRLPTIDEQLLKAFEMKTQHIGKIESTVLENTQSTHEILRETLQSIINGSSGAIVAGLSDKNGTVYITEKRENAIDFTTYRSIAESLRQRGDFRSYIFTDSPSKRYYITWYEYSNAKINVIYPFRYSKRIILQIIIELTALVLSLVSICLFFALKREKPVNPEADAERDSYTASDEGRLSENEISAFFLEEAQIENDIGWSFNESEENDKERPDSRKVYKTENEYAGKAVIREESIYEIFHKIMHKHRIDVVALYRLESRSHTLRKTCELSGRSFVKIPIENSYVCETQTELISALETGSLIVLEQNKRVMFPVFFEGLFLGALSLKNSTPIDGYTSRLVKNHCPSIGAALMRTMLSYRNESDNSAETNIAGP